MSGNFMVIGLDQYSEPILYSKTVVMEGYGSTYDFISDTVGGTIDVVRVGPDVDMWVNDEGLLPPRPEINVRVSAMLQRMIAGPVVFAAHDSEGDTIGLTAKQVAVLMDAYQMSDPLRVEVVGM